MSEEKNIVEQLRGSVTVIIDHYGNRETFVAQGGIMCEAADTIERLARERDEARAENDRMRAAIANGTSACVYCSLPAVAMTIPPIDGPIARARLFTDALRLMAFFR